MGLLEEDEVIDRLDTDTLWGVLDRIARAGIGRGAHRTVAEPSEANAARLERLLDEVNQALEESPAPSHEWPRLVQVLGPEVLARLVGVSPSSLRRYNERSRSTPDDVAARLHFLALVVGDLAGTYNEIGIRRWFDRPRTLLNGKSPARLLTGEWMPDDPGPRKVRELAGSLVAAGAT